MKYLCLIAGVSCLLGACSSGSNNTTPSINYSSVPNWRDDTMIGVWVTQSSGTINRDTVYADEVGGQSMIRYKGQLYEIKAYTPISYAPIKPAASTYVIDVFDPQGNKVNGSNTINCAASPYQYYDSTWGQWKQQHQAVMLNTPPFNPSVTGSLYSTLYK